MEGIIRDKHYSHQDFIGFFGHQPRMKIRTVRKGLPSEISAKLSACCERESGQSWFHSFLFPNVKRGRIPVRLHSWLNVSHFVCLVIVMCCGYSPYNYPQYPQVFILDFYIDGAKLKKCLHFKIDLSLPLREIPFYAYQQNTATTLIFVDWIECTNIVLFLPECFVSFCFDFCHILTFQFIGNFINNFVCNKNWKKYLLSSWVFYIWTSAKMWYFVACCVGWRRVVIRSAWVIY